MWRKLAVITNNSPYLCEHLLWAGTIPRALQPPQPCPSGEECFFRGVWHLQALRCSYQYHPNSWHWSHFILLIYKNFPCEGLVCKAIVLFFFYTWARDIFCYSIVDIYFFVSGISLELKIFLCERIRLNKAFPIIL